MTVLMVALVAVIAFSLVVTMALGQLHHERARTQGVADIAAIAAAQAHWQKFETDTDACERAKVVANSHGAALEQCIRTAAGFYIDIRTTVHLGVWGSHDVRAEAAAGPRRSAARLRVIARRPRVWIS